MTCTASEILLLVSLIKVEAVATAARYNYLAAEFIFNNQNTCQLQLLILSNFWLLYHQQEKKLQYFCLSHFLSDLI